VVAAATITVVEVPKVRWIRLCVIGALVAGIALTLLAGASNAAHIAGQVGYGAPQVIPDNVITPKPASSHFGLWLGVLIALAVIAATGLIGWRRTHSPEF
jgi:hypothetical protein